MLEQKHLLIGKTIQTAVIKAGKKFISQGNRVGVVDTEISYSIGEESIGGNVKSINIVTEDNEKYIVISMESSIVVYPYDRLEHFEIEGIFD